MTATLHWDDAADIDIGNADTASATLYVNGTSLGTRTTAAASVGWVSRSVDITAPWNAAAGADNLVEFLGLAGADTYHIRNLRVVVDADPADYGQFPDGLPYDAANASGTEPGQNPILGQAYQSGGGGPRQWSMATLAYVVDGARMRWYFGPFAEFTVGAMAMTS